MSEMKELSVTVQSTPSPNDLKRAVKGLDTSHLTNHVTPQGISRERSFIRASNPQNHHQNVNKRRSMGFQHHQHQQAQMRKPLEIYRPPSEFSNEFMLKLSINLKLQF